MRVDDEVQDLNPWARVRFAAGCARMALEQAGVDEARAAGLLIQLETADSETPREYLPNHFLAEELALAAGEAPATAHAFAALRLACLTALFAWAPVAPTDGAEGEDVITSTVTAASRAAEHAGRAGVPDEAIWKLLDGGVS